MGHLFCLCMMVVGIFMLSFDARDSYQRAGIGGWLIFAIPMFIAVSGGLVLSLRNCWLALYYNFIYVKRESYENDIPNPDFDRQLRELYDG